MSPCGKKWREANPSFRIDDPEYGWRARLFNTVTAYPTRFPFYYTSRQAVSDRLERLVAREIRREERTIERRRRRWDRQHP